jgi:hypothetical protein
MPELFSMISQFVTNIWLGWDIFWQMPQVEQIYNTFVMYSKAYHSSGILPSDKVIEEFSNKVQGLAVVKAYCHDKINIIEMIKAVIPYDKLHDYCNIPNGLDEEMARKFIQ